MALLLVLLLSVPVDTLAPCVDGQTLHRADLQAAGVGRVSDLARVLDDLDAATVDGFDSWVRTPGSSRTLRVLIDGHPIHASSTLEPVGLEWLPISVGEIEAVTFCPEPGIVAGALRGAVLHIQTAPPAPRLYGAIDYGNETGDPGPLRYIEPNRPNVDHEGPDIELAVAHRTPKDVAWLGMRSRHLYPTDTAMAARVYDALVPGRFPSRIGLAWSGRAQTSRGGGHALRAGAVWAQDLPHLPSLGREVPVLRRGVQGGARGRVMQRGRARVGYHITASHQVLARPEWGILPVEPDWRETQLLGGLELESRGIQRRFRAGIQGEHLQASGPGVRDGSVPLGRLWAQSERRRGRARETVSASLVATGREAAASGAFVATRPLGSRVDASIVLSGERSLAAEAPDLAFWTARGYAGLNVEGLSLVRRVRGLGPSEDRIRFSLSARPALGLRIGAWADARRQRAEVVQVAFTQAPERASVQGTSRLELAIGDGILGETWAEWTGRVARIRVFGQAAGLVRGNTAFRDRWRRQPEARGGLVATVWPDGSLRLSAHLEGRTATTWAGYPDPEVPATLLLDLHLHKTLWNDRLRLSFSGRNVLGAEERRHPLGATLAPRLHVRFEGRF
ncbi:MAG: hypothetical protein Rubg2KO_02360 [Rubricoccaceae bacterium]